MRYLNHTVMASALAAAMGFAVPASAQATRTWVSGVGDDLNPCSRTAPCQTFAGAIVKTASGGEINCLDAGLYGMVTITKSISIICEGQTGKIQPEQTYENRFGAIVVEAGPDDKVFLSGLDIRGGNWAGQGGIAFLSGKELHVRNSTFHNLGSCAIGVSDAGSVLLEDITSSANFCGLGLHRSSAGTLNFTARNIRITDSLRSGITVGTSSSTASVKGVVSESLIATTTDDSWGFDNHGITANASSGQIHLTIENSIIKDQKVGAIDARGAGAILGVRGSVIAHNMLGVSSQGGARVSSYGDNILLDNVSNGSFTNSATKK